MKARVSTDNAPKADHILSQGIVSNGLIHTSGQIHMTAEGNLVEGTTEEKFRQIMKNLEAILVAAGANFDDVVSVMIYVTEMSFVPLINEYYPEYFTEPLPARTAVCVKELPLGASIEISLVATK
jgi:2-iminobutanoate/2-iminopropanoate deaminase